MELVSSGVWKEFMKAHSKRFFMHLMARIYIENGNHISLKILRDLMNTGFDHFHTIFATFNYISYCSVDFLNLNKHLMPKDRRISCIDYICIHENKNLTLKFIRDNISYWNFKLLSFNHCITNEFIIEHCDEEWCIYGLLTNKNINLETIDYIGIDMNGKILREYLIDGCEDINQGILETYFDDVKNLPIHILSKIVGEKIILQNPQINWDYSSMSSNKNLTPNIIRTNIHKRWDFSILSCNKSLTTDIVEKYINKPWDSQYLSCNPNITEEFITRYKWRFRFDYPSLSSNTNISQKFIEDNIGEKWFIPSLLERGDIKVIFEEIIYDSNGPENSIIVTSLGERHFMNFISCFNNKKDNIYLEE